jgi:uncharacterized protein YbjT (DUF2867 family)
MKILLFGSTGMVGKGVLLECLQDLRVEQVLVINRQPLGLTHQKLTEIIHANFFDFSILEEQLKTCDACFFCLGVSAVGLHEDAYTKITYDLTLNLAQTLVAANPDVVFCYVSGAGTDSSEKGRAMWARVKGRTENALLKLPFKAAYMFRPGYIQPLKGIRSKTAWYNAFYTVLKPLYFLLKPFKRFVTDTVSLGRAMIEVARNGYTKPIIESNDIYLLSRRS